MPFKKLATMAFLTVLLLPVGAARAQDDYDSATNLLNLFKLVCVDSFTDREAAQTVIAQNGWPVDTSMTMNGTTAWTATYNDEVMTIGLEEDGTSCGVSSKLVTLTTTNKAFGESYAPQWQATALGDTTDGKGKIWTTTDRIILINDLIEKDQGIIVSIAKNQDPDLNTNPESSAP